MIKTIKKLEVGGFSIKNEVKPANSKMKRVFSLDLKPMHKLGKVDFFLKKETNILT